MSQLEHIRVSERFVWDMCPNMWPLSKMLYKDEFIMVENQEYI